MGITSKERDTVLRFIERNVRVAPRDLDEGIGTVYERVVIDDYFRDLQKRCNLKNILENPADGVTGVPGMNSLEFARNGGVPHFMCGRALGAFFEAEHGRFRAVLTELGLAK